MKVSFEGANELTLVSAGKRHALAARSASEVTLESVPVGSDASVAIVRVQAGNGRWVGLLGGRSGSELLLFEPSDAVGDPGERRSREIAVRGETPRSVHTGIGYEGVTACGGRAAWLEPQKLDPNSLTLVPDQQPVLPVAYDEAAVSALTTPSVPPLLPALSAHASSELDRTTQLPRVPRALVDGNLTQSVSARPGQLLTLRWQHAALPIERLELTLRSNAQPVELLWLSDGERGLRIALPSGSGVRRVAITPPTPLTGRCAALVVARGEQLELRELAAYSAIDQEGGLDRAIGSMIQDDARAGALADVLEQLGPAAADRLAARWAELSPRSKRRSLKVLARDLDREPARAALLESARGDDAELREAAIAALERGGEAGRATLRMLVVEKGPAGERAATALGARADELPILLAALSADGGTDRATLRSAIEAGIRRDPARATQAISDWAGSAPTPSAQIALALAAGQAGQSALASTLVEPNLERAQSFEDRYRLALAAAMSMPSVASDGWLAHQAEQASEWMQRRAAFDALVRRNASSVPTLADKLAHDLYPRVRAATVGPLLAAGQRNMVEVLLVQDAWPLVRAEAALVLARAPDSGAALVTALGDASSRVRRAAVEALMQQGNVRAWPQVQLRLLAANEAQDVREAALSFSHNLCVMDASAPLLTLASRLGAPDASETETQLGIEALRVLHDLGGVAASEGQRLVTKLATPELVTLWNRLPPPRCPARAPGV